MSHLNFSYNLNCFDYYLLYIGGIELVKSGEIT